MYSGINDRFKQVADIGMKSSSLHGVGFLSVYIVSMGFGVRAARCWVCYSRSVEDRMNDS